MEQFFELTKGRFGQREKCKGTSGGIRKLKILDL